MLQMPRHIEDIVRSVINCQCRSCRSARKTCSIHFYRTTLLTRDIDLAIMSVRPSVRPSRSGIVSKQLNISTYFLQHGSPLILVFTILNIFAKFLPVTLSQVALNTGGVYEFFFDGHEHCTTFGGTRSSMHSITASIIQASAIGPASYVVNAADLHTVTDGNLILKYADDT